MLALVQISCFIYHTSTCNHVAFSATYSANVSNSINVSATIMITAKPELNKKSFDKQLKGKS